MTMERREPTFSPNNLADNPEPARRPAPPQDEAPARPAARSYAPAAQATAPASSSLPAVALVIALLGVGAAAFLGWQLFQAQAQLQQADARIAGLEQRLNLTSEESTSSLVSLQDTLKRQDGELRKLAGGVETNRKAIAAGGEKLAALGRDLAVVKKDGSDNKTALATIKPELAATKTAATEAVGKVDTLASSLSQQAQNTQALKEQISRIQLELATIDSVAARLRNNEEAIAAIDEFRRSTNRELMQIKQQLGSAPK